MKAPTKSNSSSVWWKFVSIFAALLSVALTTRMGKTATRTLMRPLVSLTETEIPPSKGIRVIGAGLGRTGTSSLAEALSSMGYKPYHMADAFVHGHASLWGDALDTGDITPVIRVIIDLGYDAIVDEPGTSFVPQLAEQFPEAKVIFTHRRNETAKWIRSLGKLSSLHSQFSKAPFSFIPHIQRFSAMAKRILAARGCSVDNIAIGDPDNTCKSFYYKHMEDMKQEFAHHGTNGFLEFHVSEGWEPLVEFLDWQHNVTELPFFPRSNSGDEVARVVLSMKALSLLFYALVFMFITRITGFLEIPQQKGEATLEKTARIRGLASVIPGVNGVPGDLVPTNLICKMLRKGGIHNPKSGKQISEDWALRNLNIPSIAMGQRLEALEELATEAEYPKKDVYLSEKELAFRAFDEALVNSNTKVEDIDVVLYVSCTVDDVHFNEDMRVWYQRYPQLSRSARLILLPLGCPALVYTLKMAQELLFAPSISNVAIVISNGTSKFYGKEALQPFIRDNNMEHWLNCCIFGDAAFSCIVSDSTDNLPERTYKLSYADIVCDPELFISSRKAVISEGASPQVIYDLNPEGPKAIMPSLKHWFSVLHKECGLTVGSFQHVVFHQANPKVIQKICGYYGFSDKTAVVGAKYGNLSGTSVGCALDHRLKQKTPQKGDLVLGYALGALTGNSHGVFVLECEVRE